MTRNKKRILTSNLEYGNPLVTPIYDSMNRGQTPCLTMKRIHVLLSVSYNHKDLTTKAYLLFDFRKLTLSLRVMRQLSYKKSSSCNCSYIDNFGLFFRRFSFLWPLYLNNEIHLIFSKV